jgi:hypothetical protein
MESVSCRHELTPGDLTVEDIVCKGGRVTVREELSVNLLEFGFAEFPGRAVFEKAFVPGL